MAGNENGRDPQFNSAQVHFWRVMDDKKGFSEAKREKNMSLSIKEGSAASSAQVITDTFMTPFALALGGTSLHVGLLNSFSGFLSPLSQLYGSRILKRTDRKKILVFSAAWQALTLIPIIMLGALFLFNLGYGLPGFLIIFYSLYIFFGALASVAWFSLMGDIVPAQRRGRYFGKRNAVIGGAGIVVSLFSAFLLDYFKAGGKVLIGFSILFLGAIVARAISVYLLKKHDDPDRKKRELGDGFWSFTKKMHRTNYGRFVIYVALLNFGAMVASPFFSVYMLEELKLSYVWFTIVNLFQAVSMMLFMVVWGKFADRYGNREVLIIGSVLVPLLPLLWVINQNPYYLLLPMFIGGMGWAAFNLASSNFIYDSAPPEKRASSLANMNIFAGLGIFLGAGLGGIIIQYTSIRFMNIFLFVFLLSGVLRILASIVMLPLIHEVRRVERFSFIKAASLLNLKMIGQHTTLGIHSILHLGSAGNLGRIGLTEMFRKRASKRV